MNNPIGWFEIYVSDIQRAKAFYETVFDINLEPLGDPTNENIQMLAFPSDYEKSGASGALVKADRVNAGSNSTIVYFVCDDCSVEESRVEAAGGRIERTKMSIGEYGFCTIAVDCEGNTIGLHSEK